MGLVKIRAWLYHRVERFCAIIVKLFEPAVRVGNPDRVLKKGENNPDDERLTKLNSTWRTMLREDPWMKKLMTHVNLLIQATTAFLVAFFVCGLVLEVKHPVFTYIIAGTFATIPYWFWVGRWHNKIEKKVFAEFKKRFGKHFHLK